MQRRAFLLVFLFLYVMAASSCRSRRSVPPPQTAPPVAAATATGPTVPVHSPNDFPAPPAETGDVLSDAINEANRVARQRGWIRDAFFAFDGSVLDAEAQAALQGTASWLRSHPEYRIRIEGHCDERGTEQYNLALGDRRADTAASYLVILGVDRTRIHTVSYGEERPFEAGANEAAWVQNRRAHIVLSGNR